MFSQISQNHFVASVQLLLIFDTLAMLGVNIGCAGVTLGINHTKRHSENE